MIPDFQQVCDMVDSLVSEAPSLYSGGALRKSLLPPPATCFHKAGEHLVPSGQWPKNLFLLEAGPGQTWQVAESSLILKTPEILVSSSLSTSWKGSVGGKAKSRARIWLLGLLQPWHKAWSHVFIFFSFLG